MNIFGHFFLIAWLPIAVMLMATQKFRHRGVVLAYLVGWLFLPQAGYDIPAFPDYDKVIATNLAVLVGAMLFDVHRVTGFRPRWFDLPIAVWCVCPFASSISNGLGAYDGFSAVVTQAMMWGIPYFMGRIYFCEPLALRDLSVGVVVAALIYTPLTVFEMRMSPQLHKWVYGFQTRPNFERATIFTPFEWKPLVFMDTGFAVTMFMGVAALIAYWLWRSGSLRKLGPAPMAVLFVYLFGMTILCKTWSGIGLMFIGLGLLTVSKWVPVRLWLMGLLLIPPTYMVVRTVVPDATDPVIEVLRDVSERRAHSLDTRFRNEDMLYAKAMEEPLFGWGRWGRSRVYNDRGKDISLADGLWIISLGQTGVVGLLSLTATLLLPVALFLVRFPPRLWTHPAVAPAVPLAVVLGLHMVDNLLNAFFNPVFLLIAGGIATLGLAQRRSVSTAYTRPAIRSAVAQPLYPIPRAYSHAADQPHRP